MNHKKLIEAAKEYYYLSCLEELSESDSFRLEGILEHSENNVLLEKILYAIDELLESREDTIANEVLERQKSFISRILDFDGNVQKTDYIEYPDIQYGQWAKRYYYLSTLDCLEEQDEKELEAILEMAESNPIVSILADLIDEAISDSENSEEESRLHCEASGYLIAQGLHLFFERGRTENITPPQNSLVANDANCSSSQLLNSLEFNTSVGLSYDQVENTRNQRSRVNVMEVIVAKRVQYYLTSLSGHLLRNLSVKDIELHALNKLPTLYATSKDGWHHQYAKAKRDCLEFIDAAVKKSIYEILHSTKGDLRSLQFYSVAPPDNSHLQALREILGIPNLSWGNVTAAVAKKIGLEAPTEKTFGKIENGFEYIAFSQKKNKSVSIDLNSEPSKNRDSKDLHQSP